MIVLLVFHALGPLDRSKEPAPAFLFTAEHDENRKTGSDASKSRRRKKKEEEEHTEMFCGSSSALAA